MGKSKIGPLLFPACNMFSKTTVSASF